ncbi:TTF-type domain-containing protein [Citrus sinensis]|uniref:TTF-type domain-containing protein n=1 Tax=Citrus sinensis TaxID=2711 RepID=A0ACB8KCE6_CITSI|nr:TTF-type domain-containing protein [Citrus sinensis]
MNEEINKVVLENAPKNAQYIAPKIQKELLNIIANKVRHKIREEVGAAKFCIIVDEALDESHKEQMAIILRYVDCDGFIGERFFKIVNVDETKALTLKNEICNVLAQYNLLVENLRGQGASFKRYSELKSAREKEIIDLIALEELETGTGANQVRTLQRVGDTRWSSHFTSVSRFIEMFGATLEVLGKMINDGSSRDMRGEAKDFQLMELNSRFSEQTVELLTLSSALDPVDGFKSFDIDNICSLAEKFYPHDFTPNEVLALRRELEHYQIDVLSHPRFQNMASLFELCRRFVETMKSQHYLLIDRLIRLVLTLPVSTATTERAFSAMKLLKTSLRRYCRVLGPPLDVHELNENWVVVLQGGKVPKEGKPSKLSKR